MAAEREFKFALPAPMAPTFAAWLRGRCKPDTTYPRGMVSSIYYDTPSLTLLREKINSDFFKTKVRVRWYGGSDSGTRNAPAHLEIKRRAGGRRFKIRRASAAAGVVAAYDMSSPELSRLLRPLYEEGVRLPAFLSPVLQVSFHRLRFVDPLSGARVSLDTEISAPRVNLRLLQRYDPRPLRHAVLEIKGSLSQPPTLAAAARRLGARREAFSKYLRCHQRIVRRPSI